MENKQKFLGKKTFITIFLTGGLTAFLLFIIFVLNFERFMSIKFYAPDFRRTISSSEKIEGLSKSALLQISGYKTNEAASVFQNYCFECHAESGWKIGGSYFKESHEAREKDEYAERARESLLMTKSFPFDSKVSLKEDLINLSRLTEGRSDDAKHPYLKVNQERVMAVKTWAETLNRALDEGTK